MSARLDGEEAPVAAEAVDAHLVTCDACAMWSIRAQGLHRMVRVRVADPVPDLSRRIVDAALPPGRPAPVGRVGPRTAPVSPARWALFTVALTQLVLAGPALLGNDPGASVHVARELGSFDVALAVGLLVAAWQPARAWGLLPVAAVLAFVMVGTAGLDLLDGAVSSVAEAHHLLDLAGVGLLWLVARDGRQAAPPLRAEAA